MNKRTLEMRTAIIIFVTMTISIISIFGSLVLFKNVSDEKQASFWLDVSLSFITSIFSAGIAYVVAVVQVKSTQKLEENERVVQNKRDINLILIEMKDNLDVLRIIANNRYDDSEVLYASNQFSTSMWERLINKIEIPNEVMANLLRVIKKKELIFCEDDIQVEEIISFTQEYEAIYIKLEDLFSN
ncbi:hypothetical protein P7E02_15185 [Enterococcus hulanensis]|uniref:hypothetical protein n=1 Tax=Enterococcus hulanensis TaxID=2559929 RepID=UPI002892089D|nr:hypothetical protein [Enterococcus hulanensis]MDT2661217.1 hypothetical protein [Enterococcus hulanensis]